MKHLHLLLTAFLAVCLTALAVAPAHPVQAAPISPGLSITVNPHELRPAEGGYVFISGGYPLNVKVTLDGKPLDAYWTGDGYLALFAFDFHAAPGPRGLVITASNPLTGEKVVQQDTITVNDYTYPHEDVSVSPRLAPLLDPTLNQNEVARLESIYAARTQPAAWGWPFDVPVPDPSITSAFGADRAYNGGILKAYHTGTDFRRAAGDPILASAAGRVATVEFMPVHGNVIIIDHGYGLFSLYAHCSQVLVQTGQTVQRGQLIGLAGSTGRTNGPHLHFEIIIDGQSVDPVAWLALRPGFVTPPNVPHNPNQVIDEGTGS